MVLGGVPVTLVDTAGLREAGDEIEAEGVRRARARAAAADLVITVEQATPLLPSPSRKGRGRVVSAFWSPTRSISAARFPLVRSPLAR